MADPAPCLGGGDNCQKKEAATNLLRNAENFMQFMV